MVRDTLLFRFPIVSHLCVFLPMQNSPEFGTTYMIFLLLVLCRKELHYSHKLIVMPLSKWRSARPANLVFLQPRLTAIEVFRHLLETVKPRYGIGHAAGDLTYHLRDFDHQILNFEAGPDS